MKPPGGDVPDGAVIDPTKNVLDLVKAESLRQDGLRLAEQRRIDDLAHMRDKYDARISDMLQRQVEHSSVLLSTQVNDRLSKLEQFRYESSGKGAGMNQLWGFVVAAGGLIAAAFATAAYFMKGVPPT